MQSNQFHASKLTAEQLNGGAYYLKGSDSYWLPFAEKIIRSTLPSDSLSLRILEKINDVTEIISAFDTICFTDDKTVVIVKDNEYVPSDKEHAALQAFLTYPFGDNILCFCGSPFLNAAETKLCTVIDCSPLDRFSCGDYVEKLFPAGIEKKAVRLLMDMTGCDMARIGNEAQKLNAYCENTLVSVEDVETCVTEDTETTVFLFANSVVEGRLQSAEKQLEKLLKRGEKPAMLLSVLTNQFRRMLFCAVTPYDNKQMADLLGIKEFAVEKTRNIKGYSQAKLKSCVAMLTDCEFKFKSGVYSDEAAFNLAVSHLLSKEAV